MKIYTIIDPVLGIVTLTPGEPFTTYVDGEAIQHPGNALELYSPADLARYGITVTEHPDPDPPTPAPRYCSVYDLMYVRVTQAERLAIRASTDPVVVDFVEALRVIPRVELDGALTIQGVNYLESVGLLAAGRAAEILGG